LPDLSSAYEAIAGADHRASLSNYLTVDDPDAAAGGDSGAVQRTRLGNEPVSAEDAAAGFRSALGRLRRNELDRAMTLVGPHRDDLVLELNGMPARGYASHGESWSFALALKLAAAQLLRRESSAGDPVLILDDVFAELDESRRARLAGAVKDFEQVLITAAVLNDVPDELRSHTVRIAAGVILESEQSGVGAVTEPEL
jgi:DNA replication and repair protein RecF